MIASLHKKALPLKACMVGLALSLCIVMPAAPLWAQSSTDAQQTEEQAEQEANEQSGQPDPQPNSEPRPRERYYLGERPRLQRQTGPALGKPKSITPRPFVPRGSVQVPAAPAAELAVVGGDFGQTPIENPAGEPNTIDQTLSQSSPRGDSIETENAAETNQIDDQFLEAGSLALLDPSGVGVLPADSGYQRGFWAGYTRADVAIGYGAFEGTAGSRALSNIARKIALSDVVLPAPDSDSDILPIIQARLVLLASLGDTEGYVALLERLPVERDWSVLVKDFTNKHLLKGELGEACAVAAEQRANDDDAYWLRLAAFCEAARGNRIGVDFQLGILEEVSEIRPTFYQLIDQILVEASQAPGTIVPEAAALSNNLTVDLLEVTMARLARAKVPLLALEGVNPLAVRMMLALPGVERDAKIDLMGFAVRRGWINSDGLAAFAVNYQLEPGEMEAALEVPLEDGRFAIDAALLNIASKPDGGTMRADALGKLWERSVQQHVAQNTAGGYGAVTKDIVPTVEAASVAGLLARSALISGDHQLAVQWFTAHRSTSAGNMETDATLVGLAPLLSVLGTPGAPVLGPEQLALWWKNEETREDRFERANLLFTVLEALGTPVSEACWQWLEDGPAVFAGGTPSAALWRRYLLAVENRDVPKSLALSFALMAEGGPSSVPGALAGSLLGGLMDLGLEDEARSIAIEMLVGQGL